MSRAPFLKEQDLDAVSRLGFDVTDESRFGLRLVAADEEQGLDDTAREFLNEWDADRDEENSIAQENADADEARREEEAQEYDGARGRWGNCP